MSSNPVRDGLHEFSLVVDRLPVRLAELSSAMESSSLLTSASLDAAHLVAALPIGAALVVAARTVFGIRTIGVFAPVLMSLGVLAVGVAEGLLVIAAAVVGGLIAAPLVQRLAMPRIARLGLLLCVVCAAVQTTGVTTSDRAALPLLTIAVIVERCWDTMEIDGVGAATRLLCNTAVLAAVVGLALVTGPVVWLVSSHPGFGVAVGGLLIVIAGSYRGLRLGERKRFRALREGAVASVAGVPS